MTNVKTERRVYQSELGDIGWAAVIIRYEGFENLCRNLVSEILRFREHLPHVCVLDFQESDGFLESLGQCLRLSFDRSKSVRIIGPSVTVQAYIFTSHTVQCSKALSRAGGSSILPQEPQSYFSLALNRASSFVLLKISPSIAE